MTKGHKVQGAKTTMNDDHILYCETLARNIVDRRLALAAKFNKDPIWWSVDINVYGAIVLGPYNGQPIMEDLYNLTLTNIRAMTGYTDPWPAFTLAWTEP